MRLSIVNYGTSVNPVVPKYAKMEDNALIKIAKEIIEKQNMPKGAVIVSEVMHTDLANFNNRKYVQKGLPEAVTSFYLPHYTPFLMHHETGGGGLFGGGDPNLVSVGTNLFAKMYKRKVETPTGPATGYVKVATFIPETSTVGNQSAIDALQSRQLMSLSIGSRVSDDDYRCSICNKSLYDEECDHRLGQIYEDEKCYALVHNPLFREYSAVYNPSDINALVRRMDVMEGEGYIEGEDHQVDSNYGGYVSIYDKIETIYPSAKVGIAGEGLEESVPPQETHIEEDNEMPNGTSGNILEELKRLMKVYENAETELADKDKRIAELEELVNVLAASLREKLGTDSQEEPEEDPEKETPSDTEQPEENQEEEVTPDTASEEVQEEKTSEEDTSSEDIEDGDRTDPLEDVSEEDDNGREPEEEPEEEDQNNEEGEDDHTVTDQEEAPSMNSDESTDSAEEEDPNNSEPVLTYREVLKRGRSLNSITIGSKGGRGTSNIPRRFKI